MTRRRDGRTKAPVAAFAGVQQRGKQTLAVVIRQAEPIQRAIGGNQRGSAPVADDAMLLNRRIGDEGQPLVHISLSSFHYLPRRCLSAARASGITSGSVAKLAPLLARHQ